MTAARGTDPDVSKILRSRRGYNIPLLKAGATLHIAVMAFNNKLRARRQSG